MMQSNNTVRMAAFIYGFCDLSSPTYFPNPKDASKSKVLQQRRLSDTEDERRHTFSNRHTSVFKYGAKLAATSL